MFYSEIAANVRIAYSMLSVECSNENPDILRMELSRGGISDVVRPKPVYGEITLSEEHRRCIEEGIRELLQVTARMRKSVERRAVEAVIANAIGEKIPSLSEFVQAVGKVIYSDLFPAPIKESLETLSKGSLLALALDDSVVGLPWELAFNGSDFLCKKFGVGRVIYSEIAPLKKRKSMPETRVLLISNPDNSLPHTDETIALPLKEKLEKLGVMVDHMCYAPRKPFHTTKKNVVRAFASGLYDVIHFVGHGGYHPRYPKESCFGLADGKLSAMEISKILEDATKSGRDAPFLFYAHSCEAGAQRSWDIKKYESQVLGLSHAFIRHNVAYVGAFCVANVIGADRLALAFYDALLDRKEPLGLALRNARLTVLKELGHDHPNCEWANFILYGDPSLTIKI